MNIDHEYGTNDEPEPFVVSAGDLAQHLVVDGGSFDYMDEEVDILVIRVVNRDGSTMTTLLPEPAALTLASAAVRFVAMNISDGILNIDHEMSRDFTDTLEVLGLEMLAASS